MGYESRIYFVSKYEWKDKKTGLSLSKVMAELELYKLGYSDAVAKILNCFDTETDFTLYLPGCDDDGNEIMEETHEDKYGVVLKYASDKEKLLKAIKFAIATEELYGDKYLEWFEKMVEIFKDENLYIVHYGH